MKLQWQFTAEFVFMISLTTRTKDSLIQTFNSVPKELIRTILLKGFLFTLSIFLLANQNNSNAKTNLKIWTT
jgi:hypothetical protein